MLAWKFLRVILPTDSQRDSNRQIHTVTWPIHCLNCRWNHLGIQTGISIQWCDRFTIKMVGGITDRSSPSVIPSAKVNIWPICRPFPSLFLLLLPHPNSLLLQTTSPPPKKKKSPFSLHKFFKFCGHNIRVLIYQQILSVFVSNSIFLNFNI